MAVNSFVLIAFAFGFAQPRSARDWRALGTFSAFVVALFTEMYGFPLTLYFLSGWLQTRYPDLDLFSHDAGHLWHTVLGLVRPCEGHSHNRHPAQLALGCARRTSRRLIHSTVTPSRAAA